MPGWISATFDRDRADRGDGLWPLIVSDYLAYYGTTPTRERAAVTGSPQQESSTRSALLFVPRVLSNPCLHAAILIRLATHSPRWMVGLWRTILIGKHTIDVPRNVTIGPGLVLPHPHSITFGGNPELGANVTILHGVDVGTFGHQAKAQLLAQGRSTPRIGDDVVIYTGSMIFGPVEIGDRAIIGAGSWVDSDIPAGAVHRGRILMNRTALDAGLEIDKVPSSAKASVSDEGRGAA